MIPTLIGIKFAIKLNKTLHAGKLKPQIVRYLYIRTIFKLNQKVILSVNSQNQYKNLLEFFKNYLLFY